MPYHSLVLAFSQRQLSFQGYNLQEKVKHSLFTVKLVYYARKVLEFGLFVNYHLKYNR